MLTNQMLKNDILDTFIHNINTLNMLFTFLNIAKN